MITVSNFTARAESELDAREIPVSIPTSRVFLDSLSDCLFNDPVGLWKVAVTLPGAGPNPPGTAPHTHGIVPGVITNVAIASFITAQCTTEGWLPGYGWEWLRDAVSTGVATHLMTSLTDVKDGNIPHTHKWLGLSANTLKGLIMTPLWTNPSLDLTNFASKLEDYVEALSVALVDEILTNGEAVGYFPTGTTHTHTIQ